LKVDFEIQTPNSLSGDEIFSHCGNRISPCSIDISLDITWGTMKGEFDPGIQDPLLGNNLFSHSGHSIASLTINTSLEIKRGAMKGEFGIQSQNGRFRNCGDLTSPCSINKSSEISTLNGKF